ncbi:MAG: YdiU family protein [Bdellovibrionaceae bacterium]|nr:YdiU family protein [Pseudobdellovibrionaceae bacterium]
MGKTLPILDLGEEFYTPVSGGNYTNPILRYRNQKQAVFLGLDRISDDEWLQHFGKFTPLKSNLEKPLAMKYHGHQFQNYNPDLGDGRGFVFAQFMNGQHLFELGTKGSGQTPYSRRGDGRLTLKGAVRELLATDYLTKQKVLTSHTFSIVETAEKLVRHDEPSPTRSAILFRLSRGHIRIGNFQRALFYKKSENILKLVDYSLRNFYPELAIPDSSKEKIELLFQSATFRLADLCASYMVAGFVHGVLNTDNMNISGESFDYGPYRFLPYYDPYFTAAYFDQEGLYSFGRQPPSFLWNLNQLKGTLNFAEPAADLSQLNDDFAMQFNVFFTSRFLKKLNLKANANASESALEKAFASIAPSYYDDEDTPILDMNRINAIPFAEISRTQFFANIQKIIENFFQDLYQNKSRDFETAFFEILNWTQNDKTTSYFSDETLKLFSDYTSSMGKLTKEQINIRKQNLVIDEIETIWDAIDQNDDWSKLHHRLA